MGREYLLHGAVSSPGELRWVGGEQKGVPPGALGEDNLVGPGVGCWWKAGRRPTQNLKILQGRVWQQRSDICRGGLMNCGEYTRRLWCAVRSLLAHCWTPFPTFEPIIFQHQLLWWCCWIRKESRVSGHGKDRWTHVVSAKALQTQGIREDFTAVMSCVPCCLQRPPWEQNKKANLLSLYLFWIVQCRLKMCHSTSKLVVHYHAWK